MGLGVIDSLRQLYPLREISKGSEDFPKIEFLYRPENSTEECMGGYHVKQKSCKLLKSLVFLFELLYSPSNYFSAFEVLNWFPLFSFCNGLNMSTITRSNGMFGERH